jgi:hypothetical protein
MTNQTVSAIGSDSNRTIPAWSHKYPERPASNPTYATFRFGSFQPGRTK